MQMTSEDFARWTRIVVYLVTSSLTTYGAMSNETSLAILGAVGTVANGVWSLYGMRINAKLAEIGKIALNPRSPVVGVLTTPDEAGQKLAAEIPGPVVPLGTNAAVALISGTTGASRRSYRFELPINVPWFYMNTLVKKIVDAGLWEPLPAVLTNRIAAATKAGTGMEITRADLDLIPDDIWAKALLVIG